jgi:hypothetical protein
MFYTVNFYIANIYMVPFYMLQNLYTSIFKWYKFIL